MVILVVTIRRKRAVLMSISLMKVMGRKSCNNIRKLGRKRKGSVIVTAAVATYKWQKLYILAAFSCNMTCHQSIRALLLGALR